MTNMDKHSDATIQAHEWESRPHSWCFDHLPTHTICPHTTVTVRCHGPASGASGARACRPEGGAHGTLEDGTVPQRPLLAIFGLRLVETSEAGTTMHGRQGPGARVKTPWVGGRTWNDGQT